MSAFTQGLYPFEVVLLFGGVALLVILLIGLVAGLIRGKIPTILIPLFIISIVMIAYPSVQSIKYQDLTVSLNNQLQQVLANPTDPSTRNTLAQVASQVASRPGADNTTLTTLASAQYALGDESAAKANLDKVLKADPSQPAAVTLKNKITAVDKLDQLTSTVEKNPGDAAAKQQLAATTSQVSKLPLANSQAIATLAKAQTLTGDQQAAQKSTQKALRINPNAFKLQATKP